MIIRQANVEDADQFLAIYAPYVEETAITFETEVPSLEEFKKRIQSIQEKFPYLVAEKDGKILGYAYAHAYYERAAYNWTVELSIYVDGKLRQSGIGSMLYDALEKELAKRNFINFMACISLPNEASVHFHQKRGYEKVGHFKKVGYKFGQWRDILWMEKRIKEVDVPKSILYK
ncbi:sortase [Streptococcus varani]|uniref:Sortase n=1 Tax=Streptococcus varani TaxID=1608583 RepID=A0A0E4CTS1_9STRE|nr:GNAT family N-acetyltransferase [Streptococcus varani]CQR26071.1 sortase [Streptococcus varani]